MKLYDELTKNEVWEQFLQYKIEKQHISAHEEKRFREYIDSRSYVRAVQTYMDEEGDLPLPEKKEINKGGTGKKRVVYTFPDDLMLLLKLIAFLLYQYDDRFSPNCYAFRKSYGVKNAVSRIRHTAEIEKKYCIKADISNYFNSIDTERLLDRLDFMKAEDSEVYRLFERMLTADRTVKDGEIICEKRGAMAGVPVASFFANVYLSEVDRYFEERGCLYFRYSDDMLLFADDPEELRLLYGTLRDMITENGLRLNPDKTRNYAPGEAWEFLGFSFREGVIDLSDNTILKLKRKLRRKARALRRWAQEKGLDGEKAAKGYINAINHSLYARDENKEFSWSRWFFPILTTDRGLKIIDGYIQQYIRYCVTGRFNKGNYRISYSRMKEWGYRNLVNEYYRWIESSRR